MEQINLNLIPNGIPAVCHVSQYDNTGRKIRFRLFNGSDPYVLSDTETISLHIRKSNGEVLIFDIANTSSDYIDLEIASEMSDVSGESICKFYIENSNINIGSFNFKMRVEPDAFDGKITASEARGAIASFETNIEDNLIKLKSEINPVQDLHGYSKPWIGGGGKNKLDYLSNLRATSSGLTISATSGGAIHYQGTATANYCQLTYIFNLSIPSGTTVTVSRDVAVGHQHYFDFTFTDNSVEYVRIMTNTTSTTYTLPKDLKSIDIVCLNLTVGTAYNETVKFQLEYGSQATAWEPYENICPISGSTGVSISRTGINIWDEEWELGALAWATGQPSALIDRIRSKNYCPIKGSKNYYIKVDTSKSGTPYLFYYDKNLNYISNTSGTTIVNQVISIPDNAAFFKLVIIQTTVYNNNVSINYPSSDTEYHAYNGSKYQSYFSGLANGTCGLVDLGTLDWVSEDSVLSGLARVSTPQVVPLGAKYLQTPICTQFEGVYSKGYTLFNYGEIGFSNADAAPMIRARSTEFIGKTNAEIKALMSGVYLIYELATATTPTITQSEIDTLITAFNADLVTVIFGQTVYGGSLDVTNGKVTVTQIAHVFDGSENFLTLASGRVFAYDFGVNLVGSYNNNNSLCSHFHEGYGAWDQLGVGEYLVAGVRYGGVNPDMTLADYRTYLQAQYNNGTPVIIVATLATPIEITTTPENLTAIVGQNNVYHDCNGDTEVEYYIEV